MKLYKAMIWTAGQDQPGQRVSVLADSLEEALEQLEAEHGEGCVFDVHNDEDAGRPR